MCQIECQVECQKRCQMKSNKTKQNVNWWASLQGSTFRCRLIDPSWLVRSVFHKEKSKPTKWLKTSRPKKRHGKPISIEKGEKAECRGWMGWHYNVTTKCFGLVVSNMNCIFHFIYGIKHLSESINIYIHDYLVGGFKHEFHFPFHKKGME